jgi:hypothetical protein
MDENKNQKQPDKRQKDKGWRTIGGKRHYFKSKWEVNYACYLEWLKQRGDIVDWEYEPDKFWFDKIKSGTTNYTPDFKVLHKRPVKYPDGRISDIEYVEVKGFMDRKSATKIKRMGIYHKSVLLRVVDRTWFKDNNKVFRNIVPGWEV